MSRSERTNIKVILLLLTSLQTVMVPKTTCRPSKKLSPIIITVVPPLVHPSLGHMAFIHGAAEIFIILVHRIPSNVQLNVYIE